MSDVKDNDVIILDESQYKTETSIVRIESDADFESYADSPKKSSEREPLPSGWTQEKHEDGLLYTYDEHNNLVCGGWNPKRKKYCKGDPIPGKNRCKFHGGASPRGIQANNYKHGGYSRDMTEQLAKRFREFQGDTELLSLRDDIALTTAGIAEKVASLHSGEAGDLWIEAHQKWRELLKAIKRQDEGESTTLMAEIGRILDSGYNNTLTWKDIHRKQDIKRKLVDSERKRLVDMRQMVTMEELMLVVGALVDSLKKHVHDAEALGHVSADLRKLLQDRGYADKKG